MQFIGFYPAKSIYLIEALKYDSLTDRKQIEAKRMWIIGVVKYQS